MAATKSIGSWFSPQPRKKYWIAAFLGHIHALSMRSRDGRLLSAEQQLRYSNNSSAQAFAYILAYIVGICLEDTIASTAWLYNRQYYRDAGIKWRCIGRWIHRCGPDPSAATGSRLGDGDGPRREEDIGPRREEDFGPRREERYWPPDIFPQSLSSLIWRLNILLILKSLFQIHPRCFL